MDYKDDYDDGYDYDDDQRDDQRDDYGNYGGFRDAHNDGEIVGSYRDIERMGPLSERHSICNTMSTDIEGKYGKDITKFKLMHMSDIDRFTINFCHFIKSRGEELNLSNQDKDIIESEIYRLPMIRYKNPVTFILGYYVRLRFNPIDKSTMKVISPYIDPQRNITLQEIVKYARYWNARL